MEAMLGHLAAQPKKAAPARKSAIRKAPARRD
jgi:hypothetical protein